MTPLFSRMSIIGVGLIGGSLALAARERGLIGEVVGFGRRAKGLRSALDLGVIDRAETDLDKAVEGADLVVLATPVGIFEDLITSMAPSLAPGCLLTDVGSVKGALVERLERRTPAGCTFIGGHPIAGKEKSGAEASSASLFVGARCILTPSPKSDPSALKQLTALWEGIGSTVKVMDPVLHDRLLAAVSHLPHMLAYALMEALTGPPLAMEDLLSYSGGGLRDFTRIAASSPEMWRDITLFNRDEILKAIEAFQEALEGLRRRVADGDGSGLMAFFERAKEAREAMVPPGGGRNSP